MTRKTLYIIDPFLRKVGGHHHTHDQAIIEAANSAGYGCTVLASHDIAPEIAESFPVRRVFHEHYSLWWPNEALLRIPRMGKLLDKLFINLLFFWRLLRTLGRERLTPDDIVLIPTITHRMLYGCAWWYRTLPRHRRPRFILLLHIASWPHFENRGTYNALRMLERTPDGQVSLCTHSDRLAREFARFTRLPVRVLPIPIVPSPPTGEELLLPSLDPARRCFMYLGDARDEKGLVEILQAIQQLERLDELDRFNFVLQVTRAPDKQLERCYTLIEQLERKQLPNVVFIHQTLSPGEYQALLGRADVILVPYLRSEYVSRISSVFAEALASGKPVIATDDTWMSDQLERYGAGILYQDLQPLDLVRAIRDMDAHYAEYATKAKVGAAAWRELHNATAMFAALLAPNLSQAQPSKIAIVYPFWDVMEGKSGNARRTRQMIDYLRTRFDHVRVLSPGQASDYTDGNVQFLFLRQSRWQRWLTRRISERLYRRYQWLVTLGENKQEQNSLWPLWEYYRFPLDPNLRRALAKLARWADTIILEYPFWARQLAPFCKRENVRLIVTAHDILADVLMHSFTLRDIALRLELSAYRMADQVISISPGDQQKLQKYGVDSILIEHGIDSADYDALTVEPEAARMLLKGGFGIVLPTGRICLFVGSYNYPNLNAVTAIRRIAQPLRAPFVSESVNFVVVGGCCGPQTADNFVALGHIDDEALYLLYKAADLVIVPLQMGTGASVKTAEAMLYGKAVLGTTIGFRGYFVTPNVDAIICDEISDFPTTILNLLHDPVRLREIGRKARAFAMQYQYREVYTRYEQIILDGSPRYHAELPEVPMENLLRASMHKYGKFPWSASERRLRHQKLQFFTDQLREERSYSPNRNTPGMTVFTAELDYPPSYDYRPRWGYIHPTNQASVKLFEKNRAGYATLFEDIGVLMPMLAAIRPDYSADQPIEPFWKNDWLTALEAALLYTLMVKCSPQTYLEVGSGNTTLFAARAKRDHGLSTRLISIDPEPRREIDEVCDLTIRQGLETVDLSLFSELVPGDIVLIDSSHRVFMNSDVTVFMLDVLPILKPGVLVHFHDIYLPYDYPPEWSNRYYSEQYALGAWLLGAADRVEIIMPTRYMSRSSEVQRILEPVLKDWPYSIDEWFSGTSIWFTKRA